MNYPTLATDLLESRLAPPQGQVRMVLDTDTYNEIDDQFAVVHSLLSPERLTVEALYAAPFFNSRSSGPADGMEKSYAEILRLLERLDWPAEGFVYRGSTDYLRDAMTPQPSAAAEDLVKRALASQENPLYVVAIGAITNVASAILMEPSIIERIVVVWLGGHALSWAHTREFNLKQDPPAARVILDSGVPLVLIPCMGVTSHLHSTVPEIERYVQGQGAIGDYLAETFKSYHSDHLGWSKEIWDLAPIGHLLNPEWTPSELVPSPILAEDITWQFDASRHPIRCAHFVKRDPILRDLFLKLRART
ncbi:MAG: nucleoside hydrolase [Caldilineaceae bacterium]|nr:nucleoside hydrolase [Caldilineaceae bacterium]